MRSITAWLLVASFHQEPVPSQVTAAGSCAQVTLPGTTPRGTPTGESVGSKREERNVVAAAIDSANCRRVIPILITPHKSYVYPGLFSQSPRTGGAPFSSADLKKFSELYLTEQIEFSFCLPRYVTVESPPH